MQRLTISMDDELAAAFESLMVRKGYANRSEAIRDMLRRELGEMELTVAAGQPCVAVLSYIYDHHERQLSSRLTDLQHDHHDMTVATMHAHLSHEDCIETAILRGSSAEVERFAQEVVAQTGVRHGHIHLVPLAAGQPPAVGAYRRLRS